jgi:hypothetical protein
MVLASWLFKSLQDTLCILDLELDFSQPRSILLSRRFCQSTMSSKSGPSDIATFLLFEAQVSTLAQIGLLAVNAKEELLNDRNAVYSQTELAVAICVFALLAYAY